MNEDSISKTKLRTEAKPDELLEFLSSQPSQAGEYAERVTEKPQNPSKERLKSQRPFLHKGEKQYKSTTAKYKTESETYLYTVPPHLQGNARRITSLEPYYYWERIS